MRPAPFVVAFATLALSGCPAKKGTGSASGERIDHLLGHYSFAIPAGWTKNEAWKTDLKESDLKTAPKKDENGFCRGVWQSSVVYPAEGERRCDVSVEIIRGVDEKSPFALAQRTDETIDKIVANSRWDSDDYVVPAFRDTYAPVTVSGIPCMRGRTAGALGTWKFDKGEHVVGFRGTTWVFVDMVPLKKDDDEILPVARQGLDRVLATLEVEPR
jgi:hypothetical protein